MLRTRVSGAICKDWFGQKQRSELKRTASDVIEGTPVHVRWSLIRSRKDDGVRGHSAVARGGEVPHSSSQEFTEDCGILRNHRGGNKFAGAGRAT